MGNNDIIRTQKKLADLNKKFADLSIIENKEEEKAHKAAGAIKRTNSASAVNTKMREIERVNNEIARIQKSKSDTMKKINIQTAKIHKYDLSPNLVPSAR